jgi:HNH endonuclease
MAKTTLEARFWSKVALPDERGCLRWTAGKFREGYGMFRKDGRNQGAHRVAYELLVAPIPEGLQVDHLCRVRDCVSPDHLEPVTQQENMRRGLLQERKLEAVRARTHCKNGHEFTAETLMRRSRGNRECKVCHRLREERKRREAGIEPRRWR